MIHKNDISEIYFKSGFKWIIIYMDGNFDIDNYNYVFEHNGINLSNFCRYVYHWFKHDNSNVVLNPRIKIVTKYNKII